MRGRPTTQRPTSATLLAAILIMAAAPAEAVIVFEKGSKVPIRGHLVEANDVYLIVRVVLPNGQKEERRLLRAKIEEPIIAVRPERLASLKPDTPAAYRDYAEELAEKREDPDARETAIRLYLIAAYLDPRELGASCLRGMIPLARSPDEERRFQAMAYLLDRDHDRSLLKASVAPAPVVEGLTDQERSLLRTLLRMLRTQRTAEARNMMSQDTVRAALAKASAFVGAEELAEAARGDATLSVPTLRKILSLELLLSGAPLPSREEAASRPMSWSRIVALGRVQPLAPLSLETLTEFDPSLCCYRDGKWTASESKPRS